MHNNELLFNSGRSVCVGVCVCSVSVVCVDVVVKVDQSWLNLCWEKLQWIYSGNASSPRGASAERPLPRCWHRTLRNTGDRNIHNTTIISEPNTITAAAAAGSAGTKKLCYQMLHGLFYPPKGARWVELNPQVNTKGESVYFTVMDTLLVMCSLTVYVYRVSDYESFNWTKGFKSAKGFVIFLQIWVLCNFKRVIY